MEENGQNEKNGVFKVHYSFVVDFYDDVGVLTDASTQVLFLPEPLKSYFRVNVRQNSNFRKTIMNFQDISDFGRTGEGHSQG